MLQVDIPTVDTLQVTPRSNGRRRFVLVAVPDGDPFDIIGPLTVLREANFFLEKSGRADLSYQFEVVSSVPGTVFEADGLRLAVDRSCYDVVEEDFGSEVALRVAQGRSVGWRR